MGRFFQVRPFGDRACLVVMGGEISPEIHSRVIAFCRWASSHRLSGITDLLPSYCSLLIQFDPFLLSQEDAAEWARGFPESLSPDFQTEPTEKRVPVLYGGLYGPDLAHVAEHSRLPVEQVIRFHTSPAYRVYAIGGFPGLAAMGKVLPSIETPRLSTPRTRVPPGSVAIAGKQTGIYAVESPGGWQLIGRTPLRLFDPARNPPSFFQAGDRVRFFAVTEEEFQSWRSAG